MKVLATDTASSFRSGFLVKAADADIADTLTVHGPSRQKCQD